MACRVITKHEPEWTSEPDKLAQFLAKDLQGSGGSNAANAMHDAAPLEK